MSKELKILINNEEVVCDKQISIDEKMLSTSSTILKNCYPKFWETDKDYVSRFYFPKDYSKCRISYDEFHPEEQGEIVTGTNLSINYDSTKNFELLQLQGNTYQQTYTGKNLLKNTSTNSGDNNYWSQYSTYDQTTGTLTRSTSGTTEQFIRHQYNLKNNTKYTVSCLAKSNGYVTNFEILAYNSTASKVYGSGRLNLTQNFQKYYLTFATDSSTNFTNANIRFDNNGSTQSGTTATLTIKDVMLVEGEDTNFEPYVGGTPSPNPDYPQAINNVTGRQTIDVVGKNLFDKSTIIEGKYIDASGNLVNDSGAFTGDYIEIDNTKQYYISSTVSSTKRIAYYDSSKTFISRELISAVGGLLTIPNNAKYVRLSCNNDNLNTLQLEQNNQVTTYEEYKGQSYEINLGKNLVQSKEINSTTSNYATVLFVEADLKPNTTYTISYDGTPNNKLYTNENLFEQVTFTNTSGRTTVTTTTKSTISKSNSTQYESGKGWKILKNGTSGAVGGANVFNDLQLETGSQATTYSEYFTPIELNKIGNYQDSIKKSTGKNLFDGELELGYYNDNGVKTNSNTNYRNKNIIAVNPNTTYTFSINGISQKYVVYYYNESQAFINVEGLTTGTFTTPSNCYYMNFRCFNADFTSNYTNLKVQLEVGSQATTYEPYLPIGTWYIEKKIGKIDFGDITWNSASHYTPGYRRYYTSTIPNVKYVSRNYDLGIGLAEKYKIHTGNGMGGSGAENCFAIDVSIVQAVDKTTPSGLFYYALATPEYEVITNTELIDQLESIELLNGINNIMVSSGDLPGALNIHYNFKEAYTESDLVFCGIVKNTGNISLNPREPHFVDLQILDFKTLLSEGETLNYVITDKTIPKAIEQVVESISDYGFVIGNINILNPNDKINAYSTLNKTAYDVFQYIADVTQSKWATRVIDEDTIAIDFYDPTLMPKASPIEYNQTYFENNDIENMTFNYSTNDYRNKQIMTSDEVFGNIEQIETIISNGYQDTYTCQNKIGIIKKITVNDVECTFATKNEVELGVTADFEYQPGEMTFTSNQTYSAGAIIIITYYPIVKGREIILNSGESTRITNQINRKGTISRYENRNDTTSGQELIKIGQSYIKYKGSAEITLKIVSSKNLFNVGQIVEFNAPLEELSTEYMVKNKTIDIWNIDSNETQVFYTYELSSNFNSENAINYFDNQRAKNQGNIGEGETIVRNIDIENTVLIQFYETNIEEVEISNISTLDFSLDAVLI